MKLGSLTAGLPDRSREDNLHPVPAEHAAVNAPEDRVKTGLQVADRTLSPLLVG
jgi:hypothetical protein